MSNLVPEYLPFPQLQKVAQHLAAHTFCQGTARNYTLQTQSFIQFCDHYHLHLIDPDVSTVWLFIIHLTCRFSSACSIRNYVSRVRILHKELGLTPAALDSFQLSCMLRVANISMEMPLLR